MMSGPTPLPLAQPATTNECVCVRKFGLLAESTWAESFAPPQHRRQFRSLGWREIHQSSCQGVERATAVGALLDDGGVRCAYIGRLALEVFGRSVIIFPFAGATSGATVRMRCPNFLLITTCVCGRSRSQCEGRGFDSLPLHLKAPVDLSK